MHKSAPVFSPAPRFSLHIHNSVLGASPWTPSSHRAVPQECCLPGVATAVQKTAAEQCKVMPSTGEVFFYFIEMHHSPVQTLSSLHHPAGEPMAAGRLFKPASSRLPNFFNSQSVFPQPRSSRLPQRTNYLNICISPNSAEHRG